MAEREKPEGEPKQTVVRFTTFKSLKSKWGMQMSARVMPQRIARR